MSKHNNYQLLQTLQVALRPTGKMTLCGLMLLGATNMSAKTERNLSGVAHTAATAKSTLSKKPVSFVENKGQIRDQQQHTRKDIDYTIHATTGLNIFVGAGAIHYQFNKPHADGSASTSAVPALPWQPGVKQIDLTAASFDMDRMDVELVGINKNAKASTGQKLAYEEHYNLQNTKGAVAHSYDKIVYKDIYPHIDWVIYTKDNKLKHEFVVKAGGKVSDIKLKYGGATALIVNKDGGLLAETPQGTITENAPYTYQLDGKQVASKFVLQNNILTYETGAYKGELTIDPDLEWATYYGGASDDYIYGSSVDGAGSVYISGYTQSVAGIATAGAYHETITGPFDAILAKFSSTGGLLWATYLGGENGTQGTGVTTDSHNNVYLTGVTAATTGIATAGAYQETLSGGQDLFIAKFNSSGTLQWSTYVGGEGSEAAYNMAVDNNDNIFLAGYTTSTTGIATAGASQTSFAGSEDGFVMKFSSAGAIVWGTYVGGSGEDELYNLATDYTGNVYVTGYTTSTSGIATPGAYQETIGGGYDCYLTKFNNNGILQWATYYGGNETEIAYAAGTDHLGNVYISGFTLSASNIATAGAHQEVLNGSIDAMLVKFNSAGTLQWGTYYGGEDQDQGLLGLCVDNSDRIYITGVTTSTAGIATPGAVDETFGGSYDGYLAQFDATGALLYGTYWGDAGLEEPLVCIADRNGAVYLAGIANGDGAATAGAYQEHNAGSLDCFLVKYSFGAPATPNTVCVGQTITLDNGGITGGTWTSASGSIANVGLTTGVATGVHEGSVLMYYHLPTGALVTTTVTVKALATTSGAGFVCQEQTIALANSSAGGGAWSVNDPSVATISGSGGLSGASNGIAVVSYTTTGGCVTTKNVTVNGAAAISGDAQVCVGQTLVLSGATAGGNWSSSSAAYATVTSTGVVRGVAAGSPRITYVSSGCWSAFTVTVNALSQTTGESSVCQGQSTTLVNNTPGGVWSSSNTAIATVTAGGVVTGAGSGAVTIAVTSPAGCVAEKTINIAPGATTPTTATICKGQTTTLNADVAGGVWSSSSNAYATVTAMGVVSGVNAGSVRITYALTGCQSITSVTINQVLATSGATSACQNQPITLANSTPGGGVWSSDNTTIATVNSTGLVSGASGGSVAITFTASNGCLAIKNVTFNGTGSITGATTLCVGQTTNLSNNVAGGNWISSSGALAQVTAAGIVTGVAAGSPRITYIAPGGCWSSATLTVNARSQITGGTAGICASSSMTLANTTPFGGVWSSSNTSAATVSSTGFVKGTGAGSTTISFTTNVGGCVATRAVNVNACRESNGTTSVSTISTDDVKLYPNPNKGQFSLSGDFVTIADGEVNIEVVNMLGQVIYKNTAQVANGKLNKQIELQGNIASGMYLLNMRTENAVQQFHFVVRQ